MVFMAQQSSSPASVWPSRIPLFPLCNTVLLPGGELPLNIFEPRYLAMTEMAMTGDRLIGMIQPKTDRGDLYQVGCVGRIVSFLETDDRRYLITLKGLRRFSLRNLQLTQDHYYMADVDWSGYGHDEDPCSYSVSESCRRDLRARLEDMLAREHISVDWDRAAHLDDTRLYTILAMLAPLKCAEKQALLEAHDIRERCRLLLQLLDMATPSASQHDSGTQFH